MDAFATISIITVAVFASVTATPIADADLQDIVTIATISCYKTIPAKVVLDETENTRTLQDLHIKVNETIDELNATLNLTSTQVQLPEKVFISICSTFTFNFPAINNVELNDKQNSYLQNLIKMSTYAHFLKSQENDHETLNRVISYLKYIAAVFVKLLPMVTCDAIEAYIEKDINSLVKSLTTSNQPLNTIAVNCILTEVLKTFTQDLIFI